MKQKTLSLPILLFMLLLTNAAKAQYLVGSEFLNNTSHLFLGIVDEIQPQYDVDFYRLTYNTTNTAGEPTIASGAISIPVSASCWQRVRSLRHAIVFQ